MLRRICVGCLCSQMLAVCSQDAPTASKRRYLTQTANALGLSTPAVTIVLFAAAGNTKLDAETAYTTLAVLTMVTHPTNMIMTIVPRAIASLASFQRIQDFVSKPNFQDTRRRQERVAEATSVDAHSQVAIEFKNVDLKLDSKISTLEDVSFRVNCGSIVVCTGSTGVGKSVLGLAVAGEIAPSKGSISTVGKRTGLCVQSPWLPGQSISETIQGFSGISALHDDIWYRQVLDACCVDDDILLNPASRDTGNGHARLSGGQRQRVALTRAVYQRHDILILDDPFSALDQRTQERVIVNLLGHEGLLRKSHTTVFLITNALRAYSFADRILLLKDKRIQFDGDYSKFHGYTGSLPESLENDDKAELDKEKRTRLEPIKKSKLATKDDQIDLDSGPGDMSVYQYYLRSVGATNMLALLTCTAFFSFFSIFPQYWIKWWTEARAGKDVFYMLGYLLSSTIAWAATSGTLWVNFIKLAPRSGAVLHSNLLSTVLGAPLSYFINNDIGTIVNRFSQDIKFIDRDLPSALAALCTQIFKVMMQCSLLLASQRLLVFTLPIYCFLIYIIQKVYLRTSRQLRYLELESKSAVCSSFFETVEGLATIRAFGWQQNYLERNTKSLDFLQRACYIFMCLQRWLNVTLDLAVAFIALIVISLAVFYSTEDASADVGIALNMVLVTNTTLLRLIGSWTTLEVSVGAAARLKELEDRVPNEEDCAVKTVVPCDWPSAGSLTLKGVRVSYG